MKRPKWFTCCGVLGEGALAGKNSKPACCPNCGQEYQGQDAVLTVRFDRAFHERVLLQAEMSGMTVNSYCVMAIHRLVVEDESARKYPIEGGPEDLPEGFIEGNDAVLGVIEDGLKPEELE